MEKVQIEAINQDDPLETIQTNINIDFKELIKNKKKNLKWKDLVQNPNGIIEIKSNMGNLPIYRIGVESSTINDDKIHYSIVDSNNNKWFKIDPKRGDLFFITKVFNYIF